MNAGRPGGGRGTGRGGPDPDAAVFVISVAAELTGLHPQTLRSYERMGLISPTRTGGGGRRYSHADIERLRDIAELTASGVGVEGVRRMLALQNEVDALRGRNAELVAELDATREALRQAVAQLKAAGSRPGTTPGRPERLPVLRPADPGQALLVWRRQR